MGEGEGEGEAGYWKWRSVDCLEADRADWADHRRTRRTCAYEIADGLTTYSCGMLSVLGPTTKGRFLWQVTLGDPSTFPLFAGDVDSDARGLASVWPVR